uniref:Uncharacterized protein n=1 Tax=Glossina pallidipes TaxID=7398 RepID=A0A1B0AHI0_GLOPL
MKHRITSHGKNTNVACKTIFLAFLESLHGWFTTYTDMDVRADTHFYGITSEKAIKTNLG